MSVSVFALVVIRYAAANAILKDTICHSRRGIALPLSWDEFKNMTYNWECVNPESILMKMMIRTCFVLSFKTVRILRNLLLSFPEWSETLEIVPHVLLVETLKVLQEIRHLHKLLLLFSFSKTCHRMSFVITIVISIVNILRDQQTIINNKKTTPATLHFKIELTF